MKRTILCVLAGLVMGSAAIGQEKKTAAQMPPSVVKTVPQCGDLKVDPSLKEVTATFSKDMITKQQWSWCQQSPETFPEIDVKKIRYLKDKRTCVLPVKLKPNTDYIIWINTQRFTNFKDTDRNSAIPYLLTFKTAAK